MSELNLEELPFKIERPSNRTTKQLQDDVHRYLVFSHQTQSEKLLSKAVALAQVGMTEIQSRFNKNVFRRTLAVSILSLLVSVVALFVSLKSADNTENKTVHWHHTLFRHMRYR